MRTERKSRSLGEIAGSLRSGELSLLQYLEELKGRFEFREPNLQAFLPEEGRFERLRREAEVLLERYPEPPNRPPLFGVPVGVKDIFHVDGFLTRAGSRLPEELFRGAEAESVRVLRAAGALVVGKTVTTEFAYFAPGPTRNPHNPDYTPGGSSSGSAAAVSAGVCLMALGTQTIGSINRPASYCGVVGFKPSYERVSRAGVIPLSPSADTVGFFTPSLDGTGLVGSLLCSNWEPKGVSRRPVLGVPEGPYLARASEEGLAHFRTTCQDLSQAGFEVKSVRAMEDFEEIYVRQNVIVAAEAAQVHAQWFARYADLYHPKTVELIQRGQKVDMRSLNQALDGRFKLRDELNHLMEEYGLDLWVSPPACGPAPKGLDSTGDPVMNLPWTHAGLPNLTLPSGFNELGLPMGLQVTGRLGTDEVLLKWAEEIEAALRLD
jgi:Asp-tRNA(Asn)/Glu-tRNA(Gln) amidotransferase A subunit family amidase